MEFDLLIRNGTVIDGSGAPGIHTDLGAKGDRIEAIGKLTGSTGAVEVDATDLVVAPGFVDVHVHSESALLGGQGRYGGLLQGVATHPLAPDGFGWAPLSPEQAKELSAGPRFAYGASRRGNELGWPTIEAYLQEFTGSTPANVVPQVPHCAVRFRHGLGDASSHRPEVGSYAWDHPRLARSRSGGGVYLNAVLGPLLSQRTGQVPSNLAGRYNVLLECALHGRRAIR